MFDVIELFGSEEKVMCSGVTFEEAQTKRDYYESYYGFGEYVIRRTVR